MANKFTQRFGLIAAFILLIINGANAVELSDFDSQFNATKISKNENIVVFPKKENDPCGASRQSRVKIDMEVTESSYDGYEDVGDCLNCKYTVTHSEKVEIWFEYDPKVFRVRYAGGNETIINPNDRILLTTTGYTIACGPGPISYDTSEQVVCEVVNPDLGCNSNSDNKNEEIIMHAFSTRQASYGFSRYQLIDDVLYENGNCANGGSGCESWSSELSEKEIKVEIEVNDGGSIKKCSDSSGNGSQLSTSSCSSGLCTQGPDNQSGFPSLDVGDTNMQINYTQDQTMSLFGSVNYEGSTKVPSVKYSGSWIMPEYSKNQMSTVLNEGTSTYEVSGSTTKIKTIGFTVTDSITEYEYTYELNATDLGLDELGSGESETDARRDAYNSYIGRIPLQYVLDDTTTIQTTEYDYVNNRATTQYNYSGSNSYYVIYQGGIDPTSEDTLERIWVGDDKAEYSDRGSNPSDGRWLDIDCEYMSSGEAVITKVSSCSSCGGASRAYSYTDANTGQIDGYSTGQLLESVKDSYGNILACYDYDQRDRMTASWLGNQEVKITEWIYDDGQWTIPTTSGGSVSHSNGYKISRRDFVDSVQYRLQEYYYDDDGKLTEEKQYHHLQSGDEPVSSSRYIHTKKEYIRDTSKNLTTKITTLVNGTKITEEYAGYDKNYQITKLTRTSADDSQEVVVAEYDYIAYVAPYQMTKAIDIKGGTTYYKYSGYNLITRVGPVAIPNPSLDDDENENRVTTIYEYNADDRVTKETVKGENDLVTEYDYDTFGNMTIQIVKDPAASNPKHLTTYYQYSLFNELTRVKLPEKIEMPTGENSTSIKNIYYSTSGVKIGESQGYEYDDGVNAPYDIPVSAVRYQYDSDGRLVTKSVVNENSTLSETPLKADIEGTSNPVNYSWVHDVYLYDEFGRKTAVIADAGTGCKNLTTSYEYNGQSEITKNSSPDGAVTSTIRNGLGLVEYRINEMNSKKATTRFFYDESGNLIRKVDPEGVTEVYDYDNFNRKIRERKSRTGY